MTKFRLLLAAGAAAALSTGALAETATVTPGTTAEVDVKSPQNILAAANNPSGEATTVDPSTVVELDDDFVLPTLNLPIEALDDYDLVDRDGKHIGEFEEVIGPDDKTAAAVVIEFDGPGWGLFDDDVERVVDIAKLSLDGDRLIVDITADEVITLPVYLD
ncbi:MAG: hypothetical protein AcusKO_28470 [Acuticoccus sp.]